jgi:Arginase family
MDRHADLNTPATTPSGCVDGMVVSHLTGRGAAELVRFWGEPPLVREPDLALFGVDCLDPSEEEALRQSPLRSFTADEIKRMGAAAAAKLALERIHAGVSEFVLHLDVDVIADFRATNYPASGGLTPDDVRESLNVFVQQKSLAAIEVTAYNPSKDPDGSAAKAVIDLIADALEKRLQALSVAPPEEVSAQAPAGAPAQAGQEPDAPPIEVDGRDEEPLSEIRAGEAWSSDSLEGAEAENGENQGETSESSTLPTASDENRTEPAQPSELSSGEPQSLEPAVTPGEETSESQEQSDETTA